MSIAGAAITPTDCIGGPGALDPSHVDAEWLANTTTGQRWLASIRARYPKEIGDDYENSLRCGAAYIRGWLEEINRTGDVTTNPLEYLCRTTGWSPLWMAPYGITGDRPDERGKLIAVYVSYNDHENVRWPVVDDGCRPKCSFRFWYPCEPIWPGYEPHITGWQFSLVPGRIRPSGGTE